jgi:hypothetical protein
VLAAARIPKRAAFMHSKTSRPQNIAVLLAVAWLLIAAQLFAQYWTATASSLFDSDDAMRLVEVRSFLAGHGWFNLHEARIDPPLGYDSHWSRLIDAGLAGLFALFRWLVDNAMAERLMRTVWPILWIMPMLAGTAAIAWRIAGRPAALIALVFAVIGMPAFHQFTPGRIDHHNVQMALSVLALAATVWSDRLRWAPWAAGALTGFALAIGFESLPYLTLCGAALATCYVIDRARMPALRAYGLSVAASTAAAFLVSVGPDHWMRSACDEIAVNSAAPVVIGGLIVACGVSLLKSEHAVLRLALVALSAGSAALIFSLIEPRCLSGPYAMMAPAAKSLWLANIPEMKSFVSMAHDLPLLGAWMAPFPLLALLSAVFMAQDGAQRRDFGFLVSVAALLIATTLTVFMIKGFSYGIWLGMPLVAAGTLRLFARLKLTNPLARAVVILTLAPLTLSLAASSIAYATAAPTTADERVCFQIDSYAPLARLKTGNVATNILDYAPHVLALTSHSVMAAPYHRLSDAILAEYRAFATSPADARRIFVEAHVDYVAICGSRGPVGVGAAELQAGLWGLLQTGKVPDWLALVPQSRGQAFTIYRVMP